jgi:hypothetical protein
MYKKSCYKNQDKQCTYNVTMMCFRSTIVAVEKQKVLHIYSECVSVALVTQHAMRMRHIAVCGL